MILTIGIPTYNRADCLLSLLKSLSKQIRDSTNLDVEILVSDNASTDNTAIAVKSFQENNSDLLIKYYCNKSNLGYDQNVSKLFQLASGQYVMTMGDDDDLEPNAIEVISQTLEDNFGVKVVYIANSFYDVNLKNEVEISIPFFANVGESRYFKSSDELFSVTREVFGGISGICLKKKSWLESNVEKYYGTNWIHLGVTLDILRNSDAFVITQPLIKYRLGNKGSRWDSLKTNLGIQRILVEYYDTFPNVIEDIYNSHRYQARIDLMSLDFHDRYSRSQEILMEMKAAYNVKKWPFIFIDIPMLYCPGIISKPCWNVLVHLKKIIKKSVIYLLVSLRSIMLKILRI